MLTVNESESGYSLGTPDFRLEFSWIADRWVHAIVIASNGDPVRVAQSFESDPDRANPRRVVSPTYQQMEIQRGSEGPGALLLGQFGPHHFSAVFAMRARADGVEVEVDVADRCRAPMDAFASTYTVLLPTGDLVSADSSRISFRPTVCGGGRLDFGVVDGTRAVMAEGGRLGVRVQADATVASNHATQRCIYRWQWWRPGESSGVPTPIPGP